MYGQRIGISTGFDSTVAPDTLAPAIKEIRETRGATVATHDAGPMEFRELSEVV